MRDVVVVDTGTANLASMLTALRRAGAEPMATHDATRIARARCVVLPGVGSFAAGMKRLRARGVDEAIAERVANDRPLLGVCLGLQLLCEASDESPGVAGLAVIPHVVRRFTARRVPQLGWNYVSPLWWEGGYAYFANSYRLDAVPAGWRGAMSDHDGPFVAALERGAILACQFHPELSGAWGASLLKSWLEASC